MLMPNRSERCPARINYRRIYATHEGYGRHPVRMSFYGDMPDMFTVILNKDHKLIQRILDDAGVHVMPRSNPKMRSWRL